MRNGLIRANSRVKKTVVNGFRLVVAFDSNPETMSYFVRCKNAVVVLAAFFIRHPQL